MSGTTEGPGPLVESARHLLEDIRSRAERTEAERCVPAETIEQLKVAGLFRAFQSRRYGGLESVPLDFFEAVIEIGAACPSTAWVLAIMGIHQFELARLPIRLQEEILADDQDALIASSYAPQGQATAAPGGFRLSGSWKSSSGIDHASWIVLGGVEPSRGADGQPTVRTFHVPRTDVTVVDDWFVLGLGGTGSKSVVVDDVFVPAHRANLRGGFLGTSGSAQSAAATTPLYLIPQDLMYLLPGAAPALGAALGAYEVYRAVVRARTQPRRDGQVMAQDPFVQQRLARAWYTLDSLRSRLRDDMIQMWCTAEDGRQPTAEERARYLWDYCRVADDCVDAVRGMFETAGAGAVYHTHPLQRFYRDVVTMRQHGTQNPDRGVLGRARVELGIE